jgi:hypothetical protein
MSRKPHKSSVALYVAVQTQRSRAVGDNVARSSLNDPSQDPVKCSECSTDYLVREAIHFEDSVYEH